jgi:hypothetical protein
LLFLLRPDRVERNDLSERTNAACAGRAGRTMSSVAGVYGAVAWVSDVNGDCGDCGEVGVTGVSAPNVPGAERDSIRAAIDSDMADSTRKSVCTVDADARRACWITAECADSEPPLTTEVSESRRRRTAVGTRAR